MRTEIRGELIFSNVNIKVWVLILIKKPDCFAGGRIVIDKKLIKVEKNVT